MAKRCGVFATPRPTGTTRKTPCIHARQSILRMGRQVEQVEVFSDVLFSTCSSFGTPCSCNSRAESLLQQTYVNLPYLGLWSWHRNAEQHRTCPRCNAKTTCSETV